MNCPRCQSPNIDCGIMHGTTYDFFCNHCGMKFNAYDEDEINPEMGEELNKAITHYFNHPLPTPAEFFAACEAESKLPGKSPADVMRDAQAAFQKAADYVERQMIKDKNGRPIYHGNSRYAKDATFEDKLTHEDEVFLRGCGVKL